MANDSRSFTYEDALERARRGAALLDEKEPGWRSKVIPDALDLINCFDCVLGQVFGRFGAGLDVLDVYEPEDVGFMAPSHVDGDMGAADEECLLLHKAWREVLSS